MKSKKISTFAGSHNKRGFQISPFEQKEKVLFDHPTDLKISPNGLFILVCDMRNQCIRKICVKSGQVSIYAGIPFHAGYQNGSKGRATFWCPKSLIFSPNGNYIFVCDSQNHCIRSICVKSGEVSTFAGVPRQKGFVNGPKEQATFNFPTSIAFNVDGKIMFVCEKKNYCIRQICMKSGNISSFAGIPGVRGSRNGPKEQALFHLPTTLTLSKNNKFLIICDRLNVKYIKIKN
jgi:hypothetical protein